MIGGGAGMKFLWRIGPLESLTRRKAGGDLVRTEFWP